VLACLVQNPGAVRALDISDWVDPAALGQHAARALTAQDATPRPELRFRRRGGRSERILVTMVVAALAVLLVPQGAWAVKQRHTCPPSFDLGALTAEQAIALTCGSAPGRTRTCDPLLRRQPLCPD
jgi:hypothetical protein